MLVRSRSVTAVLVCIRFSVCSKYSFGFCPWVSGFGLRLNCGCAIFSHVQRPFSIYMYVSNCLSARSFFSWWANNIMEAIGHWPIFSWANFLSFFQVYHPHLLAIGRFSLLRKYISPRPNHQGWLADCFLPEPATPLAFCLDVILFSTTVFWSLFHHVPIDNVWRLSVQSKPYLITLSVSRISPELITVLIWVRIIGV